MFEINQVNIILLCIFGNASGVFGEVGRLLSTVSLSLNT